MKLCYGEVKKTGLEQWNIKVMVHVSVEQGKPVWYQVSSPYFAFLNMLRF